MSEASDPELRVIDELDRMRSELRHNVRDRRRWLGSLRRSIFARNVQGSNIIEGDESLLKSLQFMMIRHDLSKNPGQWRPGAIRVEREGDHEPLYEAPDRELVPELIGELIQSLSQSSDTADHAVIRAAMAPLNLVMIHPYSDGNGRMARCLQTLVLAREQILAPESSSIEEYLGHNTTAYHDVLATVGQGAWNPGNDARPWIRFCLTAHRRQAQTLLRRVEKLERRGRTYTPGEDLRTLWARIRANRPTRSDDDPFVDVPQLQAHRCRRRTDAVGAPMRVRSSRQP